MVTYRFFQEPLFKKRTYLLSDPFLKKGNIIFGNFTVGTFLQEVNFNLFDKKSILEYLFRTQ